MLTLRQDFISNMLSDNIFGQLHFSNAFNCLHRDFKLNRVLELVPERNKFSRLALSSLYIQIGKVCISSEQGPQEGEPLGVGGLLFCLALHPIQRTTFSPVTTGFMDDVSLC